VLEEASVLEHPVTSSADRRGRARAQFKVGLRSAPYLADHGFQGMVVLPGSFYVEMARRVERELPGRAAGRLRNLRFLSPVLVAAEDTLLTVEVEERGRAAEYTFHEGDLAQPVARLEIDRAPAPPGAGPADAFSIEAFQAQSEAAIDAHRFYAMLGRNGNHYGPGFQRVSRIWHAGQRALGELAASGADSPSLLDAMIQVLAFFAIDQRSTFVLRSIESIELAERDVPDTLWVHAALAAGAGGAGSLVGDLRVFDGAGEPFAALSGVALSLLDPPETNGQTAATPLVIASNFTAEPVDDSLGFWGKHFGAPVRVEFAPYAQVFQQLLDAGSALRRNRHGVNAILLALEGWAARDRLGGMALDGDRAQRCFGDRARAVLPNGLEVVHLNKYETDYLYKEIFEDQSYLRHGIRLRDGATVVDIGANIGLFSLFVMSRCADARIYAFEPAPPAYERLKANCEAYGANALAFNLGVSDRPKTATLTYYEKSSVFSGFFADEAGDREAIEAVVRNTLRSEAAVEGEAVEDYVAQLTADRLRRSTHECRMTSVSEIIRENRIERIDLLKIDAEKSELDIVRGIEESDWPKIGQIVVEIHDPSGEAVRRIESFLRAKGYRCAVEQERLLERSGLSNLYATRDHADAAAAIDPAPRLAAGLQRNVRDFCAALAQYAKQATAPLILCVCPRAPAAQADADLNAALDDAERTLLAQARALANVRAISSAQPLARYPLGDYYDAHGHQLGRIPYTPECYAAIGTEVYRALFNLKRRPLKAIVLDCDNTLWRGVCGEDGALGVEVSAPYRRLQEFMVGQMRAGMLLCLCSRNNEKDVLEVFDRRPDMALKREHFAAWRINWGRKSDNLRSLAGELGLGLDSFVFIDDNPAECADVRSRCPGVLTLQLPQDVERIPAFLDHAWAFDHAAPTEEDRNRTRMYRENAERHKLREQACSLKDFINGLELRVEIAEASEEQLARVSQLTYRTNQFNFTTVRRTEGELKELLRGGHACQVVCVADRFGDYGLVGVVLYAAHADRYQVDTLLLSCRVLGKGVEHAVLAWLGRRALGDGKRFVELGYRPTQKNAPVREFLHSLGAREAGNLSFEAERLARLAYDPDARAEAPQEGTAPLEREIDVDDLSAPLQAIAEGLNGIDRLAAAIEQYRLEREPPTSAPGLEPAGTLHAALLAIWKKVLGRSRIGMNENFFDLGGTSLRAVQVIAGIRKELNRNVSILSLFESPTVNLLAARLSADSGAAGDAAAAGPALRRGQKRRNVMRRKAA
jgi:FkbH-like protein/FkbM family methyltransferase